MADRIVVVGAGIAGLAAALELAPSGEVELVERLPEVGGTWGFEHPLIAELCIRRIAPEIEPGAVHVRFRAQCGRMSTLRNPTAPNSLRLQLKFTDGRRGERIKYTNVSGHLC